MFVHSLPCGLFTPDWVLTVDGAVLLLPPPENNRRLWEKSVFLCHLLGYKKNKNKVHSQGDTQTQEHS